MISNEFFYETNITINDKILFDIYSNNKNLFIDTNATFSNDKRYHSAVVYLDSNESKPISQFHLDSNIINIQIPNYYEISEPDIIIYMKTELAKEINRTDYYDFINKKKYKINKITTKDGQDLWVKYLFAFYKLLEHIYGHDVIGVITLEEIAHIKWVNDNTIVEPTTNINIKKLIFCAKSVFQKFILQYQRKLPSFEHETNNFMANIPSESSVHIIDIINNIPYMSLVCSIQLLNGTKALNLPRYGSFIQFNNIYNIDEIPKAIFYLFYKPNITQTAIQDIMQYYLTFMDTCMNVNIFKCLNNQKKAFQKPFDSYDCFGMQKSIDPKCTYNGLLNYIDYVSNKDSKSVDILNEIQNFINNAKFKYLPICFFFCIDKNILFALLNLNNRISDNSLCIAAYSKDGKILLQGDCNNNQTNTNTEPKDINIQIPEYQKIIFIVNENNDKTNINSQLSINEIKFIIENQENYKKLCDCKQYIPVLVSSYLERNILTVSLLYSVLFDKENDRIIQTTNIKTVLYLHCMIAFIRIYKLDELRKTNPTEILSKITNIKRELDKIPKQVVNLVEYFEKLINFMMINALPINIVNYITRPTQISYAKTILNIDGLTNTNTPAVAGGGIKKIKQHHYKKTLKIAHINTLIKKKSLQII